MTEKPIKQILNHTHVCRKCGGELLPQIVMQRMTCRSAFECLDCGSIFNERMEEHQKEER
jgi:transcription elongation factor Elf1